LALDEILAQYPGKVRVVFKHKLVHGNVKTAHLASCGAAKQGKFKEFYKAFWEQGFKPYMDKQGQDQSSLSEQNVYAIAAGVGLDVERLKADMPACEKFMQSDEAELSKFRVGGTPAFFINGEFLSGFPRDGIKPYVEKALKVAEASGVPGAQYYEREVRGKGEKSVQRPRRQGQ
jgi:protein-disulfide isomerase